MRQQRIEQIDLKKRDKILSKQIKSGQKRNDANDIECFNMSNKRGGESCKQIVSGVNQQLQKKDMIENKNCNEPNSNIDQMLQMGK